LPPQAERSEAEEALIDEKSKSLASKSKSLARNTDDFV